MIIQLKNDGANINLKGSKYLKGEDGYTPIKGVDYWTEEDKQEIIDSIDIESAQEVYIGVEAPGDDSDALLWMNPEGEGDPIDVDLSNYYTKEEVDEAIAQAEVGSEVDLSDYVKKTDIGSNTALGLVKTLSNGASYGVNINSSGILSIVGANASDIANKSHSYKPLTPNNLDYIMEIGLTTNSRTLSAEKQAKAKEWLGIEEGAQVDLTNYRTLNNNTFEEGIVATNGVSTMNFTPTGIDCGTGAVEISATGEAHFNDIYSNNELVATQQYVDDTIAQIEPDGVYVGTEEPTDPDKLIWINPDGGESVGLATQQWVNEQIAANGGSTDVDLSDYYTKEEVDGLIPDIPLKKGSGTNSIMTEGATRAVGNYSISLGLSNDVVGHRNVGLGAYNSTGGNDSIAIGNNNTAGYQNSMVFGHHLKTKNKNQMVIGKNNLEDDTVDFIIGNGSSSIDKNNAMTIDTNNQVHFPGSVVVGENKDEIATKAYIDAKLAEIGIAEEGTF